MSKNNPIRTALRRTGLFHEYQRMAALDTRVTPMIRHLLTRADYCSPGETESLFLSTLREATQQARHHFRHSDPNVAAHLAREVYWAALVQLEQQLFEHQPPLFPTRQDPAMEIVDPEAAGGACDGE